MEIFLDKRAVKAIRLSAADAIEEGDTEALKEDILEAFPGEQVESLKHMLGGSDFTELLDEILDEWSGDDVDELFDLLETQLGDHGIDLKYPSTAVVAAASDDDEEDEEVDDDDDEDDDAEKKEDEVDFDEYEEPGFEDEV